MNKISKIVICLLAMLIIDIFWINTVMKTNYGVMVRKIQKTEMKMNYLAGFMAYVFMAIAFVQIVVKYNLSLLDAFIFGLSLFAVYDFTTGAIFTGWNWPLAYLDILWGGILFATLTYIYKKL